MKRVLAASLLVFGTILQGHAAESDTEFAQRLQRHVLGVTTDVRVVEVAREASPSNILVEFHLDAEGRVDKPKIVHSILSQDAQKEIIAALTELPPLALNGYVANATFRLPLRLEYTEPAPATATAQ